MGYRNNNGLRRSELKCFNWQGPHMVNESLAKLEHIMMLIEMMNIQTLESPLLNKPITYVDEQIEELIGDSNNT